MEQPPVVQVARLAEQHTAHPVPRALNGWHAPILADRRPPVRAAAEILMES
jgi:hypothetical protein